MTPTEKELAQRYVRQGFDWIKEHGAKYDIYLSRIDPGALFVNSMDRCALAQASERPFDEILFILYTDGVHHQDGNTTKWCKERGFLPFGYDGADFIDQHWRELIAQDREE